MKQKKPCAVPSQPDKLKSYFMMDKKPLIFVTVTGLLYNIGLTAGPWFEGQLVQTLVNVYGGSGAFYDMLLTVLFYLLTIAMVQGARAVKRFYVRRFANDTSRAMRHILYENILLLSPEQAAKNSSGEMMVKAVADVDACAEGLRKFTTEVFDTGVALIAYLVMLFVYDARLALLSCLFTPLAYIAADRLKTLIYKRGAAQKKSAAAMAEMTYDLSDNAMTYRTFGCEKERGESYEHALSDYEKKAVRSGIWENTPQPIYQLLSMAGVVMILYFGSKNVVGTGRAQWDIAAFTAFLACFAKMAVKSSKAAKLFNAVQKAQVSWNRIKPLMKKCDMDDTPDAAFAPCDITLSHVSFAYADGKKILQDVTFPIHAGEVVGVTGAVACGKSTLGRLLLNEMPYEGHIFFGARELRALSPAERCGAIGYMGQKYELFSDTLDENIRLGGEESTDAVLSCVCLDEEARLMPQGKDTFIGSGGVQLSGGQQARTALARALYHKKALYVLDDPFSAVDKETEKQIIENLRAQYADCAFLILSHRVAAFAAFDRVVYLENGTADAGTHAEILNKNAHYAKVFHAQTRGGANNA